MIDLSTVQILPAIPEKILTLEAANRLLSNDKQVLTSKNEAMKMLCILLVFILAGIGLYQVFRHLKKEGEGERKIPDLRSQAPRLKWSGI